MIKIGVCDVNEDETCRTVYLLKSQIKFDDIDEKKCDDCYVYIRISNIRY